MGGLKEGIQGWRDGRGGRIGRRGRQQRSSSRKACGSLYTGEEGGEEDGIEGVVGETTELRVWYEFRVSKVVDMCFTYHHGQVACV